MYGGGYGPRQVGGYGRPAGGRGYGVDVNGDGIVDYRVRPGVGVDVNGDGIADYRTGPTVTRGPGMRGYGAPGYVAPGYGAGYGAPGYGRRY